MSIKPFALHGREAFDQTARRVLRSWDKLIDRADEVAALLWVGDSTEILVWSGDMDQPLEWGRYEGFCNLQRKAEPYFPGWFDNRPPQVFAPGLPELTYADLRDIIAALKRAALEVHGVTFHPGMTFDPSPEFSESPFKYDEHVEVLSDHPEGPRRYCQRMVSHQATLHADPRRYAAYPDGIPEGTTMGAFLGGQARHFAEAMGYDYLWLSNGFGFSHYAWHANGDILETDGKWYPDRVPRQLELLKRFWTDFREACPDLPLEFRGTNQSLGVDLSTDAASHELVAELSGSDVGAPNLPVLQAELLARDIATYLTRIAGAPSRRLIYRAYLNDPWHEHNPWHDIYNREPFETFSCMSCARLRGDGSLDVPTDLHILTTDNERGEMPQDDINEVIPGYLRALSHRADAAGPLVLVYPFKDFHRVLEQHPDRLPHLFACDHYLWRSIESGLPLNTVIEADEFAELQQSGGVGADRVWIAPTPVIEGRYERALIQHMRQGGGVLLFGSLAFASDELRGLLGIDLADEALAGDFAVSRPVADDDFDAGVDLSGLPLKHHASTGGGGIREVAADNAEPWLSIEQNGARRAWATLHTGVEPGGQFRGWVRGTVPYGSEFEPPYLRPTVDAFDQYQRTPDALRVMLARFGYDLRQRRADATVEPIRVFLKRQGGAWWFEGSKPDTTTRLRCRLPHGAPLFTGQDTVVRDGYAHDTFSKTIDNPVRFFVPAQTGKYRVTTESFGLHQSHGYAVRGLKSDTVIVFPDPAALRRGDVLVLADHYADKRPDGSPVPQVPHRVAGDHIVIENHTGPLYIKW